MLLNNWKFNCCENEKAYWSMQQLWFHQRVVKQNCNVRKTTESRFFWLTVCRKATWRCSFKIAAPSCFYIQREKTHNFSLVLDIVFRKTCYSYFFVNMQANKLILCWKDVGNKLYFKDFVSKLLNLLGLPVYLRRTLLNGCLQDVANAQDKNVVWKFVQRKL